MTGQEASDEVTEITDLYLPPGHEWDEDEGRPVYKLYTASEVAEALGVVERTVRRWISSERLPATKEHGVYRIRLEDAREVLAGSRAGFSGRGSMAARIEWLEAENERLWSLLERAVSA